jgi:hypothetical protein
MNKAITLLQTCFLFCLAGGLSGCGSTQSENIKTKGISAQITVTADSVGKVKVSASLFAGSGLGVTSLNLSADDLLKATANGATQVLTKNTTLLGEVDYTTTFDHIDPGTLTVVSLERKDDTSCPNSRVQLPDAFTITAPSPGQIFNRTDTISVNWTPPVNIAGSMYVDFLTTCTSKQGGSVTRSNGFFRSDSGATTIPVTDLFPSLEFDTTKDCTSEMVITRSVDGALDPGYGEGGSIKGVQSRTVSLILKP